MEPMALGSPPHSPPTTPGTVFLPPFLMGDFNQPTSPRTGSLSPTKCRTMSFGNSPQGKSPPQPQQLNYYSTPLRHKTVSDVSFSTKANGPPTLGLFDTLGQNDENRSMLSPTQFASPVNSLYTAPSETAFNNSEIQSPMRNYRVDSVNRNPSFAVQSPQPLNRDSYVQNSYIDDNGNPDDDEFWVTVFGFPSNAASIILTQFSNCGNILEKKFPPTGNWVWLKFASKSEAGRALALNGRVFSGSVMIGVVPCSHLPNANNSTLRGGARQLFAGPRLQNTSVTSPVYAANASAQRSSGPIARALEYVFGW